MLGYMIKESARPIRVELSPTSPTYHESERPRKRLTSNNIRSDNQPMFMYPSSRRLEPTQILTVGVAEAEDCQRRSGETRDE